MHFCLFPVPRILQQKIPLPLRSTPIQWQTFLKEQAKFILRLGEKFYRGSHTKRGWKRKISSWNFIKQKREKESFRIFLNTPKRCILYTDVKTISIHFHICTRSSILCWMFTFQFRMWKLGNLGKWGWGGKMGGVFFVLHRKLGGISHEFSPTRGEIRNGGLSVEIQNGTPWVVTFTLIIRAYFVCVQGGCFSFRILRFLCFEFVSIWPFFW